MKVCLVSGTLKEFPLLKREKGKADLICFGGNGLGLVSYKKELDGETEYFHEVAKMSRLYGSVVISGLDTDTYGIFRRSAVIAEKGRILGVTDANFTLDESEFKSGGNLRVYETGVGKIGVLVGEDVYCNDLIRSLSICDADIIISVYKMVKNSMPQVLMRAGSFSNGVNICMVADNYIQATDHKGNVIFATGKKMLETEIKIEKEFHTITLRRRGYSTE